MTKRDQRLVTYGTLAPGRINHHQLDGLTGTWTVGTVKGRLQQEGWGATHGFPGLVLDPDGPAVEVFVFQSNDLPDHWARLDMFEGEEYRRALVSLYTDKGLIDGYIYVLNQ